MHHTTLFGILLLTTQFAHIHYDDLSLKKCDKSDDYSIHGLWGEYNISSYPQWCDPSRYNEFNESVIQPILNDLNENWYSCPTWSIDNYKFWQHEWKKHGTCMRNISVIEYFTHTLSLFQEAKDNNWFGCCKTENPCLIPFSKNFQDNNWLGYCHNYYPM